MRQAVLVSFIVLSFGISLAIRVRLEKQDVEYIATTYSVSGEPEEFHYFSTQVGKVTVDDRKRLVYAIGERRLSVLRILPNKTLELVHTEKFNSFVLQSVQTCKGFVTVAAVDDAGDNDDRMFVFRGYKPGTGNLQMFQSIPIAQGPEHHVITRKCKRVIVANSQAGKITIINFRDSKLRTPAVLTISFSAFANQIERLKQEWFLVDSFSSFDQAVDPKWVCLNARETIAYISLPRNNGIAVVDLRPRREHVSRLRGLGLKNWAENAGTQGFDGSRTPQEARLKNAPIFSTYSPAQLSCQTIRKKDYIFFAGERVNSADFLRNMVLDEDENFPSNIQDIMEFGDVLVLTRSPQTDPDGDNKINILVMPGSRSFSVVSGESLTVIADTGSDIEQQTMVTVLHNANPSNPQTLLDNFDKTSPFGGPEAELVITKQVCRGRYVVMIGAAKQPGHLFVYTLDTDNLGAGFVFQDRVDGYERKDSRFTDQELYFMGLLSLRFPQGLTFASSSKFNGKTMVVSGSIGSSTVELFDLRIDCSASTPRDNIHKYS